MDEYIEKPDVQYILHIESDKKVEKRLIDYCLESVVDVFEDTGLTADVQPIKCAKWILFDKDKIGRVFHCSNCCKVTTTDDFENSPLEREEYYCPRCGARMDGDTGGKVNEQDI